MSQTLAALDDSAEEVPDVASHGELCQADEQRHDGDGEQEHQRCTAVDDILHRAARDDGQRDAPHVERQVLDGHQPLLHPRQVMLDQIGSNQWQYQHEEHLVHDHPEGGPETDINIVVDEREYHGNSKYRNDIGQEDIAGHCLQVATQFARNYWRSAGTRTDDTRQDTLHQNQVFTLHLETQNQRHQ